MADFMSLYIAFASHAVPTTNIAQITSITECCLVNNVEMLIIDAVNTNARRKYHFLKYFEFHADIVTAIDAVT